MHQIHLIKLNPKVSIFYWNSTHADFWMNSTTSTRLHNIPFETFLQTKTKNNSFYQLETKSLNEDFRKRMLLFIGRLHCVRKNFPPAFHIHSTNKQDHFPIQCNVKSYALAHCTERYCTAPPHILFFYARWWSVVTSPFIIRCCESADRFRWKRNNKMGNSHQRNSMYRLELKFSNFNLLDIVIANSKSLWETLAVYKWIFEIMKSICWCSVEMESVYFLVSVVSKYYWKVYYNSCLFCLIKKRLARLSMGL